MTKDVRQQLNDLILALFGKTRTSLYYSRLTDEEYVGYITAVLIRRVPDKLDATMLEVLTMVRELHKRRLL